MTETGLAMMFNSHAPANLWVDAFTSATYIINRLPTPILENKSPFEVLFTQPPSYAHFRIFRCRFFPYLRDYTKHKLLPRSAPCIFIGYSPKHKGYRCLEPTTSRIYITRHAKFDEENFPFSGIVTKTDEASLLLSNFDDNIPTPTPIIEHSKHHNTPPKQTTSLSGPTTNNHPSHCSICPVNINSPQHHIPTHPPQSNPILPGLIPPSPTPLGLTPPSPTTGQHPFNPSYNDMSTSNPTVTSPSPRPNFSSENPTSFTMNTNHPSSTAKTSTSSHPMTTRSKLGIFKPKHFANLTEFHSNQLPHALFATHVRKGFKTASKTPKWVDAMNDELRALHNNNTWELVQRPPHSNVVGSKWIYRIKYKADGSLDRYKARLVVQGFTQVSGHDYSYTFSPVVKASTIRVILSLATIHNWELRQLDVNNAFLNGHLTETVYMEQPPGFVNPKFPNHVCKLNRALNGLKQAPRAWFQRLSAFLVQLGFNCSRVDPSLFYLQKRRSSNLFTRVCMWMMSFSQEMT
ncbi:putative RNA-directed DNA polymerase [Helianthus debilis subsp. tardiflorus]